MTQYDANLLNDRPSWNDIHAWLAAMYTYLGGTGGLKLVDNSGNLFGLKLADGKPRIASTPYGYDVSEGNVTGHTPWEKIGYNGDVDSAAAEDIWSAGGTMNWAAAAYQAEVVGGANDVASSIKGQGWGAALTVYADADSSTTAVEDDDVDFTAATTVSVGDCVTIETTEATCEYGYVTAVAAHTLTVAGGFSRGGSASSRSYTVWRKAASTGAQLAEVSYLTTAFVEKRIIFYFNGATPVEAAHNGGTVTDFYRINSFRIVFCGSGGSAGSALALRESTGVTTYSYISAGRTRARNSAYTVPTGKTLYITSMACSGLGTAAGKDTVVSLYATYNLTPGFKIPHFMTVAEIGVQDGSFYRDFEMPIKIPAGVDIKLTATVGNNDTVVTTALRGWLE